MVWDVRLLSSCMLILLQLFVTQIGSQPCSESPNRTLVQKMFFYSGAKVSFPKHVELSKTFGAKLATIRNALDWDIFNQSFAVKSNYYRSDTFIYLGSSSGTWYNDFRWRKGPMVDNTDVTIFRPPEPRRDDSSCLGAGIYYNKHPKNMFIRDTICNRATEGLYEVHLELTGKFKDCKVNLCICPGGKILCSTRGCAIGCSKLYFNGHCDYSPCRYDRYGPSCEYQCRCKDKEPCDLITGNCPNGCQENWRGAACNETACPLNRFGPFCKQFCFCQYGDQCNVTTGDCYYGCEDHMFGRSCGVTRCRKGAFGSRCQKTCSLRCGRVFCSVLTGKCLVNECPVPFIALPYCNHTVCPEGTWGPTCDRKCRCEPPTGHCDPNTGACTNLRAVPKELLTNSSCPEGLWGNYCHMTCMDKACQSCLKTNGGYCEKCRDGYNLTATKDCEKDSFVLMILVVFLCVLLLILVALLLLLLKRSTKKKEDKTELVEEEQDVKEEEEEEENATPSVEGEAEGKERGSEGQVDGEEGEHHDEADDEEHPAA
ncbi:multiple epidermal growth factor-like domains protein 10 isoform X2 [Aplysia californica]|uniref:Multiple epidermal growth factor-like domains protein 10 isoform X2 n=1 Tax=Aplysia californica TaxID=6500 RepID=A0ABM0K6F3_APLCA|nr:multiple epidermal growth factor-like domains protein 10 isoform X2 [Aplysia californica]